MQELLENPFLREDVETYDPMQVMRRRFSDELLVFDLADGAKIIAERAPWARSRSGKSFWDAVNEADRKSLRALLGSDSDAPIAVNTRWGIAILFPALARDASLGIAILPQMKRRTLLAILKADFPLPLQWCGSLGRARVSHTVEYDDGDAPALLDLLKDASACFGERSLRERAPSASLADALEQLLYRLSLRIGCPVHLLKKESLLRDEAFRLPLFTAFATVSLLLCRRATEGREAYISLEQSTSGILLSVRFPAPLPDIQNSAELQWLHVFTSKHHLFFELTAFARQLHLRLIPTATDWSFLGIKEIERRGFGTVTPRGDDEKS